MPDASTICGQLEQMTGWLESRTPFVHLRFNDGEWQHGLHLVDYGTRLGNNHETHCQELERTILSTMDGAIQTHLNGERVCTDLLEGLDARQRQDQVGSTRSLLLNRAGEGAGENRLASNQGDGPAPRAARCNQGA